ncbi:MAG: alanine--tRNA ligase [Chitinispirillaceae bacterium]|nr:alanine--tRNA ligase [Chitinispirillaceae bacterium]
MKSSQEIRKDFLNFFIERDHTFVKSAPVIPTDDPTLLFTNAGMNQFKSIFLGDNPQKLKRAVNSQKCMRVSGKHNDLEDVGKDHFHHTFFEMLGNWSFGDYYKKEAIRWGWELLTEVWKLPKERLFVTVHNSDEEAEKLWKSETDIEPSRILKFGDKTNFWEMGETGPCGPCSEIHYDTGDLQTQKETFLDPVAGINGTNDRYRELWNLVFIQYNRKKDGSLEKLPSMHVDTGMGFERICAVLQGVDSNYDTDLFAPIIVELEKLSGKKYKKDLSGMPFRVIADHIRALTFAITDGALPSNEGRGYVLRRLLRRAYRYGREIGFHEPFLYKLVSVVVNMMGEHFPEIKERSSFVEKVICSEEERFGINLERGIEKFSIIIDGLKKKGEKKISGEEVFTLYDTYGFPMDLTRLMAEEQGFAIDEEGYTLLMEKQKSRARESLKKDEGLSPDGWIEISPLSGTEFVGYEKEVCDVKICRYKIVDSEEDTYIFIITDKTPFYAESGGQVGDKGELISNNGEKIFIEDTIKWNDLIVHKGKTTYPITKEFLSGNFTAKIDSSLRTATRRNHTATHLLQAALRKVIGTHIQQAGSKVEPEGLRFDFTHFKALTEEELSQVETLVNEWILDNRKVSTCVEDTEKAKSSGAIALFGEKYGEKVRVVSVENTSKELCGGTHVNYTGEIGLFHIISESSISAGVRRIEAITGLESLKYLKKQVRIIKESSSLLKVNNEKIVESIRGLINSLKELELKTKELSNINLSQKINSLLAEAKQGNFKWVVKNLGIVDKETFTNMADAISDTIKKDNLTNIVMFIGATVDGRVLFAAGAGIEAVNKYGIHCGELVKMAAQIAGGNGGGNPIRAQAGGRDTSRLNDAIDKVKNFLEQKAG